MLYFYFGCHKIYDRQPEINRIHIVDHPQGQMYCTHILTNNNFIIAGYDFKAMIFQVHTMEEVENCNKIRSYFNRPPSYLLVTSNIDRADLLYCVNADTDLLLKVYFIQEADIQQSIREIFCDHSSAV